MKREVLEVIKIYMEEEEGEINNFIKVWLSVFISLSYCHYTVRLVPKGTTPFIRLLLFFPIISLFLYLPLKLHSMHLGGMSSFFLAWLANFKLLLFAFNKGPLSQPSISLPQFIALACLPTRVQKSSLPDSTRLDQFNEKLSIPDSTRLKETKGKRWSFEFLGYLIKGSLVGIILKAYDYRDHVHPLLMWFVLIIHMYFMLDIMVTFLAASARVIFQLELEPQFNNPYLATSLQDFWGRRWNLTVTRTLRPSVYEPVHKLWSRRVGPRLAPLMAVMATFIVSAIMHELIFYYLGRVKPTWEITWFFVIHGVCLVVEIVVKRWSNGGKWLLPGVVSGPLTIGFVLATTYWLFLPPLLRMKGVVRAVEECRLVGEFFKDMGRALTSKGSI